MCYSHISVLTTPISMASVIWAIQHRYKIDSAQVQTSMYACVGERRLVNSVQQSSVRIGVQKESLFQFSSEIRQQRWLGDSWRQTILHVCKHNWKRTVADCWTFPVPSFITTGVVRKKHQTYARALMTGTKELFYVDNRTPGPPDGIWFFVAHVTSEDFERRSNMIVLPRKEYQSSGCVRDRLQSVK